MTARLRRLCLSVRRPDDVLSTSCRIVHYYGYSHVRPRRRLTLGPDATIAPNVSIRNGERITIGAGTRSASAPYLWAGDTSGRITIGEHCRLGPEVYITASDYGLLPDEQIAHQARNERDIVIGERRLARCPRLRRGRGDDRGRLCRQRELGRHERRCLRTRSQWGTPRESSAARGLRNRRSRWSRGRRRSRRGRRAHPRSTRGEAGRLDRRRHVQVPGRGGSTAWRRSTRDARRLLRDRRRGERSGDGTVERSDTNSPTYGSWSSTRTSASQPASTSAPASPPATTCSSSIPTAWCTTGPSRSLSNSRACNPRHGIYGGRTLWPDGTAVPGLVLGQAIAVEPLLLRHVAVHGVQGVARLRPGVARRLAARQRARRRHRHRMPPAHPARRVGRARRLRRAFLHVRRGRRPRASRRRVSGCGRSSPRTR